MRILQIDAFTAVPFRGNPAGVCLLDAERDESWMQNVAAEMNLAETAFVLRRDDGDFSLRWFTPAVEVALCGHATLASAHALWTEGVLPPGETARFHTKSGLLTATPRGDVIELDFPVKPETPAEAPNGLLDALGISSAIHVGRNEFDYLLEVESEQEVRTMQVDHTALRKFPVRGVIVTSRGSGEFDFISRFFAPGSGIDEDPVTGSAHCCLAAYWAPRLGKNRFHAYQASPRGGVLDVTLEGNRVKLAGTAVTVLRGELVNVGT